MKRRTKPVEEESVFDLLGSAFHLLRKAPLQAVGLYYIGAAPFVLGLLFFLSDMAASPFAARHCVAASLGMGLLYIWMRTWQSLFCQRLSALVMHEAPPQTTAKEIRQLIKLHIIYSSWGLLLLPLTSLMMLPFAWALAYFNNLCAVRPAIASLKKTAAQAWKLSMPWPKQNHYIISIISLLALLVFANIASVIAMLPGLLKTLLGIETPFTQNYYWMGNTTFLATVSGLTYLVIDPLVKTIYVLRAHTAESITTGADLLAELKQLTTRQRTRLTRSSIALILLLFTLPVFGQTPPAPPAVNQETLDATIDDVMQRSEFTWRMPRDFALDEDTEEGFFSSFFTSASEWIEDTVSTFTDAVKRFFNRLARHKNKSQKKPGNDINVDWIKPLSILLLIFLTGVLVWYAIKVFRNRQPLPANADPVTPAISNVDMDDENLVASLLEDDQWILLARQLATDGELRKSARAWFLAGIARLSRANLLTVVLSKSNLEYHRELARRARRCPAVIPAFGNNIQIFERVWYGQYTITPEDLDQLEQNLERMRHGFPA
jgi:hypothetical protein